MKRVLLLCLMLLLTACGERFSPEVLAGYEESLLKPYLDGGDLIGVTGKLSVTPPLIVVSPKAWNSTKAKLCEQAEELPPDLLSSDPGKVKTVVFYRKGQEGIELGFDAKTGALRGTAPMGTSSLSYLENVASQNNDWRWNIPPKKFEEYASKFGSRLGESKKKFRRLQAPILLMRLRNEEAGIERPGFTKRHAILKAELQARSAEEVATLIICEYRHKRLHAKYNFKNRKFIVEQEIVTLHTFDVKSGDYLGSRTIEGNPNAPYSVDKEHTINHAPVLDFIEKNAVR